MPTYEYKCDACGHAFEKFQSIKADAIKVCPECGKESVRRLIGMGAGLIFKGSGFYITDYRDKGYADSKKADSGDGGTNQADAKPGAPKADAAKADAPAAAEPAKAAESKPAPTPSPTPTAAPAAKSDS